MGCSMKEFYTVGEVSQLFKVSADTLRYYDRIGLLKPWIMGDNNYRYYSKAQFEMISTVLLLRNMGTPIAKLQTILRNHDANLIETELSEYNSMIDEKINNLYYMKKQVSLLCKNIQDSCHDETVTLEKTPDMYALLKEYDSNHDELDADEVFRVNHSDASDWISFANLISTLDPKDLERGEYHTYKTYGYLSEIPCEVESGELLRVFKSRWCVCCNARVERIDHLDIDPIYQKMMDYIEEHHYTICGDAIERSVLNLYGEKENDLTIFFRIYIPVVH